MKSIKFTIILLVGFFFVPSFVQAQTAKDEVTLVVSADGATKEEATKVALRSAIEQTYGTFVSANTTILNDELVKDEIVTVSQGNIKNYSEIASERTPDGKNFVTLRATVCISKLVSYAKNKGASTEFAGATFGMNMKMKELNKQNEKKALDNLAKQIEEIYPYTFDYKLSVAEPKEINERTSMFCPSNQLSTRFDVKKVIESMKINKTYNDFYLSEFIISIVPNEQMGKLIHLYKQTLASLALTDDEKKEYDRLNIKYYNYIEQHISDRLITQFGTPIGYELCFRNPTPAYTIDHKLDSIINNYEIIDNLGKVSCIPTWVIKEDPSNKTPIQYIVGGYEGQNLLKFCPYEDPEIFLYQGKSCVYVSDWSRYAEHVFSKEIYSIMPSNSISGAPFHSSSNGEFFITHLPFLIPKEDVSKYTTFEICKRKEPLKYIHINNVKKISCE